MLIFDIGAHVGLDTAYYLSQGHRVVAVEPHPQCAREIRSRNLEAWAGTDEDERNGVVRLAVVEKAITPNGMGMALRECPKRGPLGEAHKVIVGDVDEPGLIRVAGTTMVDLRHLYGHPDFVKLDIEGSELCALEQLQLWFRKPKYLSVELAHGTTPTTDILRIFALLGEMGYREFRYVDQCQVGYGNYNTNTDKFTWGMSGPFGEDIFRGNLAFHPKGFTLEDAVAWYFGMKTQGLLGGWHDLHCKLGEG